MNDLDLNLIPYLVAIEETRNVSRAAERLGVSQPTVSHALQRLRLLYGDPLFVRAQGGMAPTAKAQRLAKAVDHALTTLEVAIRETETYDPARSDRVFRLHLTDIGETIFLPPLLQSLERDAPRVRLEAFQLEDRDILPGLESGRIDLDSLPRRAPSWRPLDDARRKDAPSHRHRGRTGALAAGAAPGRRRDLARARPLIVAFELDDRRPGLEGEAILDHHALFDRRRCRRRRRRR